MSWRDTSRELLVLFRESMKTTRKQLKEAGLKTEMQHSMSDGCSEPI